MLPRMAPIPATTRPVKRKSAAVAPKISITDWVSVHLDKRQARNRLLAQAPAIVSSIDQKQGKVNLLFPNVLSEFFQRKSGDNSILFAIQTYPINNVVQWDGCRTRLDKILHMALLSFVEQRGKGIRADSMLQVHDTPAPVHLSTDNRGNTEVSWSSSSATQEIQKDLREKFGGRAKMTQNVDTEKLAVPAQPEGLAAKTVESPNDTEKLAQPEDPAAKTVESPKKDPVEKPQEQAAHDDCGGGDACEASKDLVPNKLEPAQEEAANQEQEPKKTCDDKEAASNNELCNEAAQGFGENDVKIFTLRLQRLFGKHWSLPKAKIEAALAEQFPQWAGLLRRLDDLNKILIAEDVILRVWH